MAFILKITVYHALAQHILPTYKVSRKKHVQVKTAFFEASLAFYLNLIKSALATQTLKSDIFGLSNTFERMRDPVLQDAHTIVHFLRCEI